MQQLNTFLLAVSVRSGCHLVHIYICDSLVKQGLVQSIIYLEWINYRSDADMELYIDDVFLSFRYG